MQFSFFEESRRLGNRRLKNELRVRLQYPTYRRCGRRCAFLAQPVQARLARYRPLR